jgi:transposase
MNEIHDPTIERHYAGLLGIAAPWEVGEVTRAPELHRVTIRVAWPERTRPLCPTCGLPAPLHDKRERRWRHLDAMGHEVQLVCAVPRCACVEHGVLQVKVPWAEPGSRFTVAFESHAVESINASRSLTQAADLLRLDWDSVQRIMERAVARGLHRRSTESVRFVGLDEKSFKRGQDYISLMTDLKGHRVLEVVEGRDTEQAVALWETLPEPQRKKIEAAAMDMGANFAAATRQAAPQASIVHDKFHVSKLLNEAVDKVRRDEHRRLLEKGDDSLKDTKFLWMQGASVTGERALRFEELCERDLKTARAWAYKETFIEFWAQPDAATGQAFFKDWFRTVRRSKIEPLKKAASTFKDHLLGLLNYFMHPITNALTEGFNSRIQAIKADARGFRRFANYRVRILFYCGKLDLSIHAPSAQTHTIS